MRLRFLRPLVVITLLCSLVPVRAALVEEKTLTGFDRESSERERALEARFDSLLKKENLRGWMKRLSARPHVRGEICQRGMQSSRGESVRREIGICQRSVQSWRRESVRAEISHEHAELGLPDGREL